jgi:hypothetical protein
MREASIRRRTLLGLLGWLLAGPAGAATYGVPTNLDAAGAPTGASALPPGWFNLDGLSGVFNNGEGVHQLRLFIEVTGDSLDILIFDPGSNLTRDIGTVGTITNTTYTLLGPTGATIAALSIGNEVDLAGGGTTDNRLVRLTPGCGGSGPPNSCGFFRPDFDNPNNRHFSSASSTPISPGLYELRIATTSATTETNMFGVDVRVAEGSAAHYNVFTLASDNSVSNAPVVTGVGETAWLAGASPTANVTQPLMLHAFVDRGCTVQTSNYDGDLNNASGAGSSASIRDALGVTTALTVSNGTAHAENAVVVEATAATNLTVENYGMYLVTNNIGTAQNNGVDWRVADFQNSTSPAANRPVQPVNPLRMYLPNGYAPATGNPNATAPAEPVLLTSARVVSGANPPVAGQVTRFFITTTFANETPSPASNVQITVGHQAGQSNQSAPYGCINGAGVSGCNGVSAATCADSSTGSYRRCTFASVPASSVASMNFEVDVTPSGPGLFNLTGAPAPLPNTSTTSAVFTAAYSSASRPTETLGPLCNLVADAGGTALATRATLRGLRASASRVEFAVSSDGNSVSFELYGTSDPTGRTDRVRLNAATIPAAQGSLAPAVYRVDIGEAVPFLLLEELDSRGRRRLMGPFPATDTRLRAAFERIEARVEAQGQGQGERGRGRARWGQRRLQLQAWGGDEARRERSSRRGATARGVAVEVREAGVVEIPLAELAAQGLRNANRRLHVSHLGQDVPFRIVNTANGLSLTFEVDRLSTDFTATNVYVVSYWDVPASVRLTRSEDPLDPGTTRVERNSLYIANAPEDADPWVWDLLFGDGSPWPYDWWGDPTLGDFDLPGLASGTGSVRARVRLLGRTDHEHTVEAFVNGVSMGSLTFQGPVPATLEGEVPLSTLRPVGNQLSVRYFGGAGEGLVYLGSLDLDVPIEPTRRTVPFELGPYDPILPRADGVTYLVVTHEGFRAQAEQLATLKRAEGHRVAVVDVERAYDRFSAGVFEARAVQALIRHFRRRGALRYVLLVGDDTFDPRDYSGLGATAFVPSLLGWDGEFGRVPSENLYADVDDDGKPDVAIGRLPVQTSEEASAVVDKIARQGALIGATRHLFAVDNQAPGDIPFRDLAEDVASRLPVGSSLAWVDVQTGIGRARDDLRTGFGSAAVVHYFGHGGPEVWADEGLLSVDDVASLPAASPAPVLFAWTCEVQWFQYIFGPSIDEALLLQPSGGIVAGLGPVGISDPVLQKSLYERVYHHFLVGGSTLGEAVRRAKSEVLAANPAARPVVEGWSLIGDPALRLSRRPEPSTGAPPPDEESGSPSSSGRR